MTAQYLGDATDPDIEIHIDLNLLVERLINNPAAFNKLVAAVREKQTKQVRRYGNVFGPYAGT